MKSEKTRKEKQTLKTKRLANSDKTRRGKAPKSRPTAQQMILNLVDVSDQPHISDGYHALMGLRAPVSELIASNISETAKLQEGVVEAFLKHLADNPGPVAVLTRRISITPGNAAVFDIPACRKMLRVKGLGMIAGLRFSPVPMPKTGSRFGIAIDSVAIYFGPNVEVEVNRALARVRYRAGPSTQRTAVFWLDPADEAGIGAVIAKLIKPCFSLTNAEEHESADDFPDDWRDQRVNRALVMLQVQSMLPVKKKLVCTGAGKAIVTGELALADHRLRESGKISASAVHRDGIPHFWFSELNRLGRSDCSVPLVKLH